MLGIHVSAGMSFENRHPFEPQQLSEMVNSELQTVTEINR